MLSREEAFTLLQSFSPEENMIQHAVASEQVMRGLAEHFGEDAELWGLTGLLHDVDYPVTKDSPGEHGVRAKDILQGKFPDALVYAVQAHCSENSGVEPQSRMDIALRAAETVTGLITAAALVRPTGMDGMKVSSLKKKMKDKAFAASVSRDHIKECEKIGLTLDDFLALAVTSMSAIDSKNT